MNNKILGVILARAGSKGVRKKNIKKLCGHPLISYSIYAGLKSKKIDKIVVSTDGIEIKKIAEKYGAIVPFLRPKKLALDHVWSRDALQHAVLKCEKIFKEKYNYVVELPAVAPLRDYIDIDKAIEKLIKTNADSVVSVTRTYDKHPIRIKKLVNSEIKDFNNTLKEGESSRRQDLEPAYVRNGAIYAMKRDLIVKKFSRKGKKSLAHIMDPINSVNIDEITDFYLAETLIKKNYCRNYPASIYKENYINLPRAKIKNKILISYNFKIAKKVFENNIIKNCGLIYCSVENLNKVKDFKNIIAWVLPTDGKIKIDLKLINKFPNLKYLVSPSTGLTHIDKVHSNLKIIYLNKLKYTKKILSSSEFAISLLLATVRNLKYSMEIFETGNRRNNENELRSNELSKFSFGIFGLGRIGSNVAKFLKIFTDKISYYDPYVKTKKFRRINNFDKFMKSIDFLIITARLNKETRDKFTTKNFKLLKKGSCILNISRGELINENDLIKMIKNKHISKFTTDVVRNEDLILNGKNKLINFAKNKKNIIVTPHIAGLTYESEEKALTIVKEVLKKRLKIL